MEREWRCRYWHIHRYRKPRMTFLHAPSILPSSQHDRPVPFLPPPPYQAISKHAPQISTTSTHLSPPTHCPPPSPLRTPAPHILHQPVPLRQPVQTVVALAHRPHEPAQRIDLVLPRVPAVLVDLADGDLHRSVVFGFDDAVRRGAFAGDVAGRGDWLAGVVLGAR